MKMKKNRKLISTITTSVFIFLNLVSFSPKTAEAFSCSLWDGCTVNVAEETNNAINQTLTRTNDITENFLSSSENRYGINENVWRTAQRKTTPPKVELFFDNTNPKAGEKVTAHAMPEFFKNDPQNLYYTWYLIHTEDGTSQTATNSVDSGKREAARIMSRGDYDPILDGQHYASSASDDPDGDGWPAIDDSYDEGRTAAPMGGADGVGGLTEESDNFEPYNTAAGYCNDKGAHSVGSCNLYTEKSSFNSYYAMQPSQSGEYCTYCQANITFSSTLSSNNQCCYLVTAPEDTDYSEYDSAANYCPSSYDAAYESCYDYSALQSTNTSLLASCLDSQYSACVAEWDAIHESSFTVGSAEARNIYGDNTSYSRCFEHNFGTSYDPLGYQGYSGSSNDYGGDPSGQDFRTDCKHRWENAPGYKSGSGKFPTGEEQYWKTDPIDPDTDGDGFNDEADVIGLGQQDFTWTYQPGDRVGVIVEGTSMIPTDEQNAYYKIMWGYLDVCDPTKTKLLDGDLCDNSGDYNYGFMATRSPNEQSNVKLKISLSFSPDNPVADPSDANAENIDENGNILDADKISVSSSLDNTQLNPNFLYYTWQIQRGDPKTDTWGDALDISDNFTTTSKSSGLGLTDFNFTPKEKALEASADNIIYFKVTATVAQTSGVEANRGRSSVIIPVNKDGVKIDLYRVVITDKKAGFDSGSSSPDKICTEGLYAALCPAVKGQMLAAKISGDRYNTSNSEFAWQTNGNPLNTPTNVSEYFNGWSNTTVFFPITKNEQQIEEVSVTVTPKDKLEPVKSSRLITVVEPVALIRSSDKLTAWPKSENVKVGSTKDSYQVVENLNMLETFPGSNVSLYLDFVPYYLLAEDENTVIDWQFGGLSISDESFEETYGDLNVLTVEGDDLIFVAPESVGAYLNISVNLKKYWSEDEVNIMLNAWDIVPRPLESDRSITVTTVEEPVTDIISSGKPTQLLAAIGTHLPHYVMYNLRLALTVLIMLFASFWLYSLIQKFTGHENN
ncbi:MAG: hypothetical protein UX02_C0001G0212 [Candidatus Moranbacteria bacterium GW2011_GWC1_45_18]|nr:MAG: hypothetical protein UT79_C0002G0185 [Candidatus Moranbacteria bacterium GW2011_GWC2_40_12]KKU00764.1 MAG: hypothetical protein UX02_C0001G0212 [Candidatus Moranbacteria bacterium GW2011_GWC1_45_18]OGI39922.1 MAG: hypothetical protein A2374_02525 [Candidatus Moranbacteria bacterium RIFOXYB1_FULL_44_23]HBU25652.1 hypothetical protein [Candidatus Moranbacteria bacterium]